MGLEELWGVLQVDNGGTVEECGTTRVGTVTDEEDVANIFGFGGYFVLCLAPTANK